MSSLGESSDTKPSRGCIHWLTYIGIAFVVLFICGIIIQFVSDSEPSVPHAVEDTAATSTPATDTPITQLPTAEPTLAPTDTQASEPSATDTAPTIVLVPTATPPAESLPVASSETTERATGPPSGLRSGGLGLTLNEWEGEHGGPIEDFGSRKLYRDGYAILAVGDSLDQVERDLRGLQMSLETARLLATTLAPDDAILLESNSHEDYAMVDLFHSESLASSFPQRYQDQENVGQFIDIYYMFGESTVEHILMGIGSNP